MTRIALENEIFLISLHPQGPVRDSISDGMMDPTAHGAARRN